MGSARVPGPIGVQLESTGRQSGLYQRPGPVGTEVRFPTLEVFAARHGDILSTGARPLSPHELELAVPIFGASVAYGAVRVVVASVANAPTTLGNFIRISPEYRTRGIPDSTVIHELTHVWQFQTRGMRYMSNSLCQQVYAILTKGDRNYAYDLSGADIAKAGKIDQLPAEKQAMFVELWFLNRAMSFPGEPKPMLMRDNPICQSMMRQVQQARPLPFAQIIEEAALGPGRQHPLPSPSGEPEGRIMPLLRIDF
jgi:hypothetical protein